MQKHHAITELTAAEITDEVHRRDRFVSFPAERMQHAVDSVASALQGMLFSLNELAQDTHEGCRITRTANNAAVFTADGEMLAQAEGGYDVVYGQRAERQGETFFKLVTAKAFYRLLGRMVTGDVSMKNISGPINIAQFAGESAERGLTYFLGFLAIISISLGVLNLLPIPVLDGGQIVYQVAELLKGSPLTERAQILGQQIGILALLLLMSFAFYNDIARILG